MEKAWVSDCKCYDQYVADPKAFIFSLVNKENKPFKVMCTNSDDAILCNISYGPIFGAVHDILIESGSNSNKASYSNLGRSYKHADYQDGSEKANIIVAGSYKFKTLEIEVFFATN